MLTTGRSTAFVTEAASFMGVALVRVLRQRGFSVLGLVPTRESAEVVQRAGGTAVLGQVSNSGRWQDEVAADWVFHLPPHPFEGRRVGWRRCLQIAAARSAADANLLDAVAGGATRRLVYVAEASYYGATGVLPVTEDAPPRPTAWGRCLAPALTRLDGYAVAGLPIVTAFAGWVYGNGAWCRSRVIEPVLTGRRVWLGGTKAAWISPIHVVDCARALVHLADRGVVGGRYFVVCDPPIRLPDLAHTYAHLIGRRVRLSRVPQPLAVMALGRVLCEELSTDAVFSASRLRGLGFEFRYPRVEDGLRDVIQTNLDR